MPKLGYDQANRGPYTRFLSVNYEYIQSDTQLADFCKRLSDSEYIGFDTEFVSEDTYYPELCLIQVAGDDGLLAVIDPKDIQDLTPFWVQLAREGHRTIAHACREEFRFCRRACEQRPVDLFDIQLAAGFIGLEYPASYGKLISKLLNVRLAKGETRTDWRRRPLTERQIEYALLDVTYLKPIHDKILASMEGLGRVGWFAEDMKYWQDEMEEAERRERWRRVSGISNLPEKALVIVREIWRWREAEAKLLDRPPRRILRDDLIVELARRGKSDQKQIRAIRGLDRSLSKRNLPGVSDAIERALQTPKDQWPKNHASKSSSQANMLSQFISTALTSICRAQQLAPSLVGTVQDVRDLVTYRLFPKDFGPEELPALACGWRSTVMGRTIEDLLDGKAMIRIKNPHEDDPLVIEYRDK